MIVHDMRAVGRSAAGVLVAAVAGMSQPVHAQVMLDLSKVTCDQWAGYKITNPQNIALWISGYFNGARGNTVQPRLRREGRGRVGTRIGQTEASLILFKCKMPQ